MLGLKLIHVSKRGSWWPEAGTIIVTGPYSQGLVSELAQCLFFGVCVFVLFFNLADIWVVSSKIALAPFTNMV